jgi:hypothetical protein
MIDLINYPMPNVNIVNYRLFELIKIVLHTHFVLWRVTTLASSIVLNLSTAYATKA